MYNVNDNCNDDYSDNNNYSDSDNGNGNKNNNNINNNCVFVCVCVFVRAWMCVHLKLDSKNIFDYRINARAWHGLLSSNVCIYYYSFQYFITAKVSMFSPCRCCCYFSIRCLHSGTCCWRQLMYSCCLQSSCVYLLFGCLTM